MAIATTVGARGKMARECIGEALYGLLIPCILVPVFIFILLVMNGVFQPLIGNYSTEVTALGISASLGAIVAAGYAVKRAASGGWDGA